MSSVSSVLVLNVGLLTTAGWGIEPSGRDDVDALRLLRLRQAKMPPVITMTTTPTMTKYIRKAEAVTAGVLGRSKTGVFVGLKRGIMQQGCARVARFAVPLALWSATMM